MPVRRLLAPALSLVLAGGCAEILGIETWQPGLEAAGSVAGAGGSGGAGGAVGAGGAGGAGGGAEDCTNGVDDDGDGATDCSDPACDGGFVCAPSLPGWTGPVALYLGPPGETPPECPALFPLHGLDSPADLIMPVPACTACECTPPPGACEIKLTLFSDGSCEQPTGPQSTFDNLVICHELGQIAGSASAVATPLGAGCEPVMSTPTPAPFAWRARTCSATTYGAGCAGGACVATQGPFERVCVRKDGDLGCPSPYTERHVLGNELFDNRTCSECKCSSPQSASCQGDVTLRYGSMCTGSNSAVTVNGACAATGGTPLGAQAGGVVVVPDPGACNPLGGAPAGTVTVADPITVCCLP